VAILDDLLYRVRLELGDTEVQFTSQLTGDGTTKDFYVNYKPLDPTTLVVKVNGVTKTKPTDYTVEENVGVIHFVTAPANNAVILVTGVHFRYFTDSDLCLFINTAVEQHTAGRTDRFGSTMTLSKIPAVEEYPVALLSAIEALWALATDAAFDINIQAPDGVMIPRSQRFAQLNTIIAARQEQYRNLCAALNIGLWRIEVGILRRTSRTTNKLVPIYMPQELEDSRRPERVYLSTDLYGRVPTPSVAQPYDIIFTQGDSWEATFDFPFSLAGYNIKAQMRTYPNAPTKYADFDVEIINEANGQAKLSLTSSDTEYLPVRLYWDLQLTSDADPDYQQTYIKGIVFVDPQVTTE